MGLSSQKSCNLLTVKKSKKGDALRGKTLSQKVTFIALMFFAFLSFAFHADAASDGYYDIGNPTLRDIWVDPNSGDDSHTGNNRDDALKTITAAWSCIPSGAPLATTGYRIMLVPGAYPCEPGPEAENCVNYFSDRFGTYQFPIIIRAADGPGTVTIRGGFNLNNVRYLYLIDLDMVGGTPLPTNISGNNLLHIALSDHVLLRGLSVIGPACATDTCNNLQEVLKVNQTQHLYVEQSTIGGAWHSSVDYMVVQHGHFLDNRIHTAGQWCMYVKGGSAYLRVEGNELSGCRLGFQAGQAANLPVMLSPWLHYEAYDVKFVNNLLRDIPGVGMSVSGGYNILFAHNTLYRVATDTGTGYGLTDFVHGERGCSPTDEVPDALSACNSFIATGGWGPNFLTDSIPGIPNHSIFIFNNVFYNPAPQQTLYSHFDIFGPIMPPAGFRNIPRPSTTDNNLVICGNVIWNGPAGWPLGNEESDRGCRPSNTTCNTTQLNSDNTINSVEPQLVNPSTGDYRPVPNGNLFSVATCAIPDFTWADVPASPPVPAGDVSNAVTRDRDGNPRTSSPPPGAYAGTSSSTVTVTPGSHDFGPMNVGETSAQQVFSLHNDGATTAEVGQIVKTGTDVSEFGIQNDHCSNQTLSPSGTCTFEAVFLPLSAGVKHASLSIQLITPNVTLTVRVSATGVVEGHTLTVVKSGTGGGNVTSLPPGIDCGSTCGAEFGEGTNVTLTANANAGSTFTGWSGACNGTGTCTVTMNGAKTVTAQFDSYQPALKVQKAGTGSGIVKSSPKGITCGEDCEETYPISSKPKKVKLTAKADKGSKFAGWTGDCSGIKTSCSLMMDASRTVTAVFGKPQISVSEGELSFGDTAQGQIVSRVLTITNTGDAELKIKSLKVAGKAVKMYKLYDNNTKQKISKVNLSPEQSITIEIQYKPTTTGSHGVTLQLKSDDPDTPQKNVFLNGHGV